MRPGTGGSALSPEPVRPTSIHSTLRAAVYCINDSGTAVLASESLVAAQIVLRSRDAEQGQRSARPRHRRHTRSTAPLQARQRTSFNDTIV